MITPELISYITSQLKHNVSKQEIINALLTAGWNKNDIESGFNHILNLKQKENIKQEETVSNSLHESHFFNEKPLSGKKSKTKVKIILPVLIILIILPLTVIFAAYGLIPITNDNLQSQLTSFILSIPFLPKTPRYILDKVFTTQMDTSSQSFTAKTTIRTASIHSLLGVNELTFLTKGSVDYSNNPSINLFTTQANNLSINTLYVKNNVYYKFNSFPFLYSAFGVSNQNQKLLAKTWYTDRTLPSTTLSDNPPINDNEKQQILSNLENDLLSRAKVSDVLQNNNPTYLFTINTDTSTLQEIDNFLRQTNPKLSNFVYFSRFLRSTIVNLFIDKSTYRITKLNINTIFMPITQYITPVTSNGFPLSISVTFSNLATNNITPSHVQPLSKLKDVLSQTISHTNDLSTFRSNLQLNNLPVKGKINTNINIVEFGDFQSTTSKQFYELVFNKILPTYINSGQISLYYFPIYNQQYQNSELANEASECASSQHKFWQFHDLLYSAQHDWTADTTSSLPITLADYATQLGLNRNQFINCLQSHASQLMVIKNENQAKQFGVTIPSLFINSYNEQNFTNYGWVKHSIDNMLINLTAKALGIKTILGITFL